MDLTNRVTAITGGRRIGAAVAAALARAGSDIAICYHQSKDAAERTAADVEGAGRRAFIMRADLSSSSDGEAFIDAAAGQLGRLDILLNMASRYASKPLAATTVADYDGQLAVDMRSVFVCSKAAWPHLKRAGGGCIVNFADWLPRSGRPRYPGYAAYYAAKAGVIALTEAMALEMAADRIRVNAIAPGPILAPEGSGDEEMAAVERATPLGAWGGEQAIVDAVLMLIACEFITGETVRVDGGRHLR